jgi:hypothetical protein
MVASCAGAALSCYLVSLRVASERAALEEVESRIVSTQRDIRLLQTEIGTRGRLAQLERWNVKVLALSAPSADQFLDGGFQLARLMNPNKEPQIEAPLVLASASVTPDRPSPLQEGERQGGGADRGSAPAQLLHQASLKIRTAEPEEAPRPNPSTMSVGSATTLPRKQPVTAPVKKAGDKPAAAPTRAVTKVASAAKFDPLAPLPASKTDKKGASGKTQ